MHLLPTRRHLLRRAGVITVASVAAGCAASQSSPHPLTLPASKPHLRFAHLTDMHVDADPRRRGDFGFAAALQHLSTLTPAPDFIITGGDHIFEGFAASRPSAQRQWDLYDKVLSAGTKLPVRPVIGNHDVWGWADANLNETQPGYGKSLACARLDLKQPYYSFDQGAWHFIVLDNIARRGVKYFGGLDAPQTEWLRADLKSAGTRPICVTSHIPLLAACAFFDADTKFKDNALHVLDTSMHHEPRALLDLLKTANTRLCISGHIHQVDRVDYRGITFICGGAISGNWWRGPLQGFAEGYTIFDLDEAGGFQHQYLPYGWKPVSAKATRSPC